MSAVCRTVSQVNRHHEAIAVAAYLRICDAGTAGRYFTARHPGECAVTRATIKPYQRSVAFMTRRAS
jgi:hypothetical protein